MSAQAPKSANGTVTLGMIVAQTFRKKTKITITTSAMVSTKVNSTSLTDARMVVVRSESTLTWTVGGIAASRLVSVFLIASVVLMTFAPGCLKTTRKTLRLPFDHAAWVVS